MVTPTTKAMEYYCHTPSRTRSIGMNHSVSPSRKLQEQDDTDRHSAYASSETLDWSYERSVSIDVVGDHVQSLL